MLKKLLVPFLIVMLFLGGMAWYAYNSIFSDNINDAASTELITIPTGSSFDDVVSILQEHQLLDDVQSFKLTAKMMKYDKNSIRSGLYKIDKQWNNRDLIRALRSGKQSPVRVTFNNKRTLEETVGTIASYLELDSLTLLTYFTDEARLKEYGYTRENALSMLIPNSYDLYWNSSAEKVWNRFYTEHSKFWSSNNRIEKLKNQKLTKAEAYTLASIVEKESQLAKERPVIAGLYLNRIHKNIPLQADPTVVFAVGDFSIRRVLNKHLAIDSPYNTYKYGGLPPGPIYLPSIQSIDAVLQPMKHDYLFMCAKPGYNSEHAFARNSAEHTRNANKYRNWLNQQGIKK